MFITVLLTLFAMAGGSLGDHPQNPVPVVQVLESGGLDTEPPRTIVSIFASGDVIRRGEKAHHTKSAVTALKQKLKKMGALNLTQAELDKELTEAGSGPAAYRRGGSGKVTLVLPNGNKRVKVTLNGPQNYAGSKIKSARIFHDAWVAITKFADKAKPTPKK